MFTTYPIASNGIHTIGYRIDHDPPRAGYWFGDMTSTATEATWTPVNAGFTWNNRKTCEFYYVTDKLTWDVDDIPY